MIWRTYTSRITQKIKPIVDGGGGGRIPEPMYIPLHARILHSLNLFGCDYTDILFPLSYFIVWRILLRHSQTFADPTKLLQQSPGTFNQQNVNCFHSSRPLRTTRQQKHLFVSTPWRRCLVWIIYNHSTVYCSERKYCSRLPDSKVIWVKLVGIEVWRFRVIHGSDGSAGRVQEKWPVGVFFANSRRDQ